MPEPRADGETGIASPHSFWGGQLSEKMLLPEARPQGDSSTPEDPGNDQELSSRESKLERRGSSNYKNAAGDGDLILRIESSKKPRPSKCSIWCANIIENKWVMLFTTVLTIYALIGDDIRNLAFEKSADMTFNGIVIFCVVVFVAEIVASCLGKSDYPLSFFFFLDLVSTATLVLDLSWVADAITEMTRNISGVDNSRASKAAKLGAKMGRILRLLRLVRLFKLYKAFLNAHKHNAKRKKHELQRQRSGRNLTKSLDDVDDEWDDADIENGESQDAEAVHEESRVGRKLSEITTRNVIALVLLLLIVLPFMESEDTDKNPPTATYGMNVVFNTFLTKSHYKYTQSMLKFVYYHNWFARRGYCPSDKCAGEYLSQVFWIGVTGKNRTAVDAMAIQGALTFQEVQQWEQHHATQDFIYNYGRMPGYAQELLGANWTTSCPDDLLGTSLLAREPYAVRCPDQLRLSEWQGYSPNDMLDGQDMQFYLIVFFDKRPWTRELAGRGLVLTAFVCVVLGVASMALANDANQLVLHPVERMTKRVEAIRDDPLIAVKMADDEFRLEELQKAKRRRQKGETIKKAVEKAVSGQCCGVRQPPMETVILEKTIIKLGSLLALGFGEAGANIIGHNMMGADSAGVNAMVPGTRVACIIGVARIRDFGIATEVLKEGVMTFVNQVSEIVHGVVNEYHGATNRNSGDAFLVIWRIGGNEPLGRNAEMSIMAFAKVFGGVHSSRMLSIYRNHPGLQQRFKDKCRVNVSFGLHYGWAIEGAVGSEFKIDASYLSPNVSVATRIEDATRIYSVPLLVAESVACECGPGMRSKCRLIDHVLITGDPAPMGLYSVDLDYLKLDVESKPELPRWNTRQRFKVRQFLEHEKSHKLAPGLDIATLFDGDDLISRMRSRYTTEFRELWKMAFQNYFEGEWQTAQRLMMRAQNIIDDDGPAKELLRYMKEVGDRQFVAPDKWEGTRELDNDRQFQDDRLYRLTEFG